MFCYHVYTTNYIIQPNFKMASVSNFDAKYLINVNLQRENNLSF